MQSGLKHVKIIYPNRLENTDEFIYLKRSRWGVEGAVIYTKNLAQECNKFSSVDQVDSEGRTKIASRLHIVDEPMPCEEFDKLLAFLIEKRILDMRSQQRMLSPSAHYFDVIGVKTTSGSENWYQVVGSTGVRPEHREIISSLLIGEAGRIFRNEFS